MVSVVCRLDFDISQSGGTLSCDRKPLCYSFNTQDYKEPGTCLINIVHCSQRAGYNCPVSSGFNMQSLSLSLVSMSRLGSLRLHVSLFSVRADARRVTRRKGGDSSGICNRWKTRHC